MIERVLLSIIAISCVSIAVRVWMYPLPVTTAELMSAGENNDTAVYGRIHWINAKVR